MRTIGRIILATAIMLGATISSRAQDIMLNHLTMRDGLSQFSINSLYIDENNVIWMGSREGLNRYDGNTITTYKMDKTDPNSLPNNYVMQLTGNKNGKIYMLSGGATEYDPKTQVFRTLSRGTPTCIYYNDGLFIGRKNEIDKYNEETGEFETYYQFSNKIGEISCMLSYKDYLYIGTHTGVYRLTITEDDEDEPEHIIDKSVISCIYPDSEGGLWVGTWEEGLYNIRPDGTIQNFRNDPNDAQSIVSNFVRSCCEDDMGNIWIGTLTGLIRYDRDTGKFQNHTVVQDNEPVNTSIWSIVKDGQGTLWVGTYFNGVNYFNPEYEIYSRYACSPIEKQGLSNPVVGRIVDDRNGNLWIATEGGGLNFYNRKTREFKWFMQNGGSNQISHNNVKALHYDGEREIIYIGTQMGGLNKLDIRSGKFTHYRMRQGDAETLPSDIIRDIEPYGDRLIIATRNGVCIFNPKTGKCRQLFQDDERERLIRITVDVLVDNAGTLWLATLGRGVYNYRFDTKELTNYRHDPSNPNSLSDNNVNNIMQDSEGRLWFSTGGGGLDIYRPESGDFENFDRRKNGFASDCIYKAVESPISGKLLLTTNAGFSIFDPLSQKTVNYRSENGFPLSEANVNALYAAPDGEIFLGSTHGMLSFNEARLDFAPKPYNIIFSRLFVNNREIQVGDGTGMLKSALYCTPRINIRGNRPMFSIEFATTNYVSANKDDILYKMEGVSDDWINIHRQNTISFTNLHPGTYNLTVKAKGKDESLCPPAHLTIRLLPPLHKTTLAYVLYVLIIAGAAVWLIRRFLLRPKSAAEEQKEETQVALTPEEALLERANRIIEEHLDDTKFNVTVFAHEMGFSRTNLFTKLKALTGQTPNDFIMTFRLNKAAHMLRNNPELNISDISDKTGFSMPRYFSKCFKDIYHISPLAYRKQLSQ